MPDTIFIIPSRMPWGIFFSRDFRPVKKLLKIFKIFEKKFYPTWSDQFANIIRNIARAHHLVNDAHIAACFTVVRTARLLLHIKGAKKMS
jgi:hypothetical protein